MTIDELILYCAFNAFDAEIIRRSMGIFFNTTRNKVLCVIAYFLNFIISLISHSIDNIAVGIVINAITISFISFQYDGDFKRKIISSGFVFALINISELAAEILSGGELLYTASLDLKALIFSRLFSFTAVLIIGKAFGKHNQPPFRADWSAIALVPISTAVLEISIIGAVQSMTIIILSSVIILFLNVIVFYLYDKLDENYARKIELAKAEQEKEIYFNQCRAMMNSQESLQRFRHDINNQFETMKALLENGNTTELKQQICSLISDSTEDRICYTGNIVADGILNYKLGKLKRSGANIETELVIPQQTFMSTKDLTIILGNLLDNAVEALAQMDEGKYCYVAIKYVKGCLIVCVKNTYQNAVTELNGSIVSSKADNDMHGIGLKSVRSIVDKYGGIMEISHSNGIFTVKLALTLPPEIGE